MPTIRQTKAFTIVGWVLSAPPLLMLGVLSLLTYCFHRDQITQSMIHLGYPEHLAPVIVALQLGCAILYAIPQTAVLGAILITGYLGGAIASHVRIEEKQLVIALILGIVTWLGLYFREERLRALIPLRRL
jgi:hypothetical protein